MADAFESYQAGMESPASRWADITPHDTNTLANIPRAIDCAADGTVAIVDGTGSEVTILLTAGQPYPVRPSIIKATGTTATGIIAIW
jgi:hypothetical protein